MKVNYIAASYDVRRTFICTFAFLGDYIEIFSPLIPLDFLVSSLHVVVSL